MCAHVLPYNNKRMSLLKINYEFFHAVFYSKLKHRVLKENIDTRIYFLPFVKKNRTR